MKRPIKAARLRVWIVCGLPVLSVAVAFFYIALQLRQAEMDHALILAIKRRDTPAAIRLLNQGASANAQDRPPVTLKALLTDALIRFRGGKPEKDDTLYSSAIALWYVRDRDENGHRDPVAENVPLIQALIAHGANVNGRDEGDNSILRDAVVEEHLQTVKLLLQHHANPNGENCLIRTKSSAISELLVLHGADVNERDENNKETPLFNTARLDGIGKAKILVAHGADVNVQDDNGRTPLMFAARCYDFELMKFLYAHRARMNTRDNDGRTALMMYMEQAYRDDMQSVITATRWLIQHGAKVGNRDRYGRTVFYYAGYLASPEKDRIIKLLKAQLRKETGGRISHGTNI